MNLKKNQKRLINLVFLIACILLVNLLFFRILSVQSLRLDEAQSLWQTSFSFKRMLVEVSRDVHVPLYHIILHYWDLYWGTGVISARYLSLIFFMISIPVFFFLGKQFIGNKIALFSTLIYTLSVFMNWYASEIRMYTLLVLFAICSHYFFLRVLKFNQKFDWFFYAVVSVLGTVTHYYFGLVLLTQAVFFLIKRKDFPARSFRKLLTVAILVAIPLGIWIYFFMSNGSGSNTRPLLAPPSSVDIFNAFMYYTVGFRDSFSVIEALWPILVVFVFLFVVHKKGMGLIPQYFLFQVVIPFIAVILVSRFLTPVFLARYLIIILPSLYLLLNWYVAQFKGGLYWFLQISLVTLFCLSLVRLEISPNQSVTEDYQGVANYLAQKAGPDDVIAIAPPFTLYPVVYYYNGPVSVRTIPDWDSTKFGKIPEFNTQSFIAQTNEMKQDYQSIWLVLSYDQGYQDEIKSYFDHHFEMTNSQHFPAKIDVYQYKFKY